MTLGAFATGQTETIGQRFQYDRAQSLDLPTRPFDACVMQPGTVDKYQTVAFDRNRYSVPRPFAFQTVSVKGYVDRISIVAQGQEIAVHERSYESGQLQLNPLHFLAVLGRKPAYLEHTTVFKHWKLPPAFSELRDKFESRFGPRSGGRQFIRVLQLLGEHPIERVVAAIGSCRTDNCLTAASKPGRVGAGRLDRATVETALGRAFSGLNCLSDPKLHYCAKAQAMRHTPRALGAVPSQPS